MVAIRSLALLGALVLLAPCGRVNYDELSPVGGGGDDGGGGGEQDADISPPLLCGNGADTTCPGQSVTLGPGNDSSIGNPTDDDADLLQGSCGGAGFGELRFQFRATGNFSAVFKSRADFDTALYILGNDCAGVEIACENVPGNGGEELRYDFVDGEEVVVVVDGVDGCGEVFLDFVTFVGS